MANYLIGVDSTDGGSVEDVLASMETYMETLDDKKVFYLVKIISLGSIKQGAIINQG